ncbi:MAG: chromosomal replication initiator protein DnaA [Rhodospirillaceae bacterium]|jgi:chromosomal replication initiator protein|nr:chromosomal replication initiator protein DnaA [Rhodospirillaceae bacterium]MBT5770941.1 chromosomal replication initiator protein DnaA [Rhodospirillaceae bacterium]MBT6309241.1 chromosomal replication initiator protein DnaA [Rhodospirillaceae bacterium]
MSEQWGQNDGTLTEQWTRVRAKLRTDVGEAAFNSWLKPLILGDFNAGRLRVAVPTRFMRDWIDQNYGTRLTELWAAENDTVQSVEIIVEPSQTIIQAGAPPRQPLAQRIESEAAPRDSEVAAGAGVTAGSPPENGFGDIRAALDERFKFGNFVVGRSNELAHAAARRVGEAKSVPFNPLFLYGGVGLGKTHLMHAIAWHLTEREPQRRVLYMSAEKFMYQFIRALRYRTIMDFKEQFRSVDVLMIDDIQFIAGKDSTQEEFFHTFNALVDQNRQIIVSADKSPSDLDGMEERLKSRLGCGLVADIHPTDYELRLGILQAKAEHIGAEIPDKVLEFLAHKITSNVRELEGALNRIVAHTTLVGRPVTLETTQDVLHDLLRANDRRVTIEEIQKRVAEHFNIRLADMHSARRARAVARPRQVAMYLAKQLTSRSLPEIGRKFGGRDHTTVMHAVRKVEELRAGDAGFNEDVELLRRMLEI